MSLHTRGQHTSLLLQPCSLQSTNLLQSRLSIVMHELITDCEKLAKCAFHEAYKTIAAITVQKIIEKYCTGDSSAECLRKKYIEKTGQDPPVSMMPTGLDAESGKMVVF